MWQPEHEYRSVIMDNLRWQRYVYRQEGELEKGLAKEPEERFATMRDLGRALAQWAVDRGVENDVAGTSIEAHWLSGRRPLSDQPPPRKATGARIAVAKPPDFSAKSLLYSQPPVLIIR